MVKGNPFLCFLSKGFDVFVYAVAIATVVGSLTLLLTDYDEETIITPLLIANAAIFVPIFCIILWSSIRNRSFSPTMNGYKIALILLLVSPIPYLATLYSFKVPDTLKNIFLVITAISPFYTSFGYMIAGLFRDCILCDAKGCDL
jgi:hypothetical protein